MQFVVIAHDYTDAKALERRMAARPAHVAACDQSLKHNEQIVGVALMNDAGAMCGSVMIMDFPSRQALDKWLAEEPYVTGKVWEKVEVIPCKLGPSFLHLDPANRKN